MPLHKYCLVQVYLIKPYPNSIVQTLYFYTRIILQAVKNLRLNVRWEYLSILYLGALFYLILQIKQTKGICFMYVQTLIALIKYFIRITTKIKILVPNSSYSLKIYDYLTVLLIFNIRHKVIKLSTKRSKFLQGCVFI